MPLISFRLKPKFRLQNSDLKKPSSDDFGRTIACVFDDGATSLGYFSTSTSGSVSCNTLANSKRNLSGAKMTPRAPS